MQISRKNRVGKRKSPACTAEGKGVGNIPPLTNLNLFCGDNAMNIDEIIAFVKDTSYPEKSGMNVIPAGAVIARLELLKQETEKPEKKDTPL